jgi:hypothetical protein
MEKESEQKLDLLPPKMGGEYFLQCGTLSLVD